MTKTGQELFLESCDAVSYLNGLNKELIEEGIEDFLTGEIRTENRRKEFDKFIRDIGGKFYKIVKSKIKSKSSYKKHKRLRTVYADDGITSIDEVEYIAYSFKGETIGKYARDLRRHIIKYLSDYNIVSEVYNTNSFDEEISRAATVLDDTVKMTLSDWFFYPKDRYNKGNKGLDKASKFFNSKGKQEKIKINNEFYMYLSFNEKFIEILYAMEISK